MTEDDWSDDIVSLPFEYAPLNYIYWEHARFADVAVPEITAEVADDGAVLMWLSTQADSEFMPFPVRFIRNTTQAYTWSYHARVTEGNIRILFLHERLDAEVVTPSPLLTFQPDRVLRWVIIPPEAAPLAETLPVHLGAEATVRALADSGLRMVSP